MARGSKQSLLRIRSGKHEDGKVAFVELFFDLVFVFAITQLSHWLLKHFTPAGIGQTTLLFMAVWWVWIYTSWVTNWLDPQKTLVRLMLFALMLAGLVLSTSIPDAYGSRGLAFACAYVFMQVGRSLFTLWAMSGHSPGNFRNFQRITAWLILSGIFWIAGGLADGNVRVGLWIIAIVIEYLSPAFGFWLPRLGRSTTTDWDVEGAHMAERCGLFMIIALGESILVTGATFADQDWTSVSVAAFVTAFIGSATMWWIYFHIGAERASQHISKSSDPGRVARIAYTYLHLPIVAGVLVTAAADEFLLAHPLGHTEPGAAAAILGGPAIFLIGNILFKSATSGRAPLSHFGGLAVLALLAFTVTSISPLALSMSVTAVLIMVAAWERFSLGPAVLHS